MVALNKISIKYIIEHFELVFRWQFFSW